MNLFGFLRKKKNNLEEMIKGAGNPGIWYYVKKEYYHTALAYLDTELNQFHDLKKTMGKITEFIFKDFEFKDEITQCDYSKEFFKENDVVIQLWRVDKKYLNQE